MSEIASYLETLAGQAHPEGGWGYAPGQAMHPEPTCLALLALSLEAERFRPAIDRGLAALQRCRASDGTYRPIGGREEAVWPTAPVLFVQAALGRPAEEVRQTAAVLLALRGRVAKDAQAAEVHDIDLKIIGWPWARGNFSWTDPTAWACLALRRAGFGGAPRVAEGLRMLLDRAFDEGGINYGNRRILGRLTEPIPGPTALMLLALQGHGDHPRVAAAVNYLQQHARTSTDLENLAWARLALDVHQDQPLVEETLALLPERIVDAHRRRAAVRWLRPSPVREALTALALATDRGNPFRLRSAECGLRTEDEDEGQSAIRNPPSAMRSRSLGERIRSTFQGLVIAAVGQLRQPPPRSAVHIAAVSDYNADLAAVLEQQYQAFRERVPLTGRRVVLKPNLVEYHRDKVINTDPRVVAAVIELCRRQGAKEVIVAEGPGHCRNVEYLVNASGLGEVLERYQVPFVDVNHDEPVKLPNLGRLTGLEYLYLARTVATADVLISLPKLKVHHWAGATLSLKNLFGIMSGICYGWPKNELHWRGIENSIVDIALTRTPELAIVDGILGMEGDGPINGTPKHVGALIMGCDPLAVDATGCRLMRLNPERVGHLMLAYHKKLGRLRTEEIDQLGEPIDRLAQPFRTVPHFQNLCLDTPRLDTRPCPEAVGSSSGR
ncbi:MAG TPA: DUF362 domain-containing protein [Gemmataceae bacterium]|nr:DUF362 domain-containing protein [Gemmataceae bacterium]